MPDKNLTASYLMGEGHQLLVTQIEMTLTAAILADKGQKVTNREYASLFMDLYERTGVCFEIFERTIIYLMAHDQTFRYYFISL